MSTVSFVAYGIPRSQGSKNYFVNKHTGRAQARESAGKALEGWRSDVREAAKDAGVRYHEKGQGVALRLVFVMPRPNDHYLPANRSRPAPVLREEAPLFHVGKPDSEKLTRAVKDALKGVAYFDDSQVAVEIVFKVYGPRPGVWATITPAGREDVYRAAVASVRGALLGEPVDDAAQLSLLE